MSGNKTTDSSKGILVLTEEEWNRLKELAAKEEGKPWGTNQGKTSQGQYSADGTYLGDDYEEMQKDPKLRMRDKSKQLQAMWRNTISGDRQRMIEEKRRKDEEREALARELDLETERYRAQKEKEALDRASSMLFHQSEGARKLKSALLLSEVLNERENQMREAQKYREWELAERKRLDGLPKCFIHDREPEDSRTTLLAEFEEEIRRKRELELEREKREREAEEAIQDKLRQDLILLEEEEERRKKDFHRRTREFLRQTEDEKIRYFALRDKWEQAEVEKRCLYNKTKLKIGEMIKEKEIEAQRVRHENVAKCEKMLQETIIREMAEKQNKFDPLASLQTITIPEEELNRAKKAQIQEIMETNDSQLILHFCAEKTALDKPEVWDRRWRRSMLRFMVAKSVKKHTIMERRKQDEERRKSKDHFAKQQTEHVEQLKAREVEKVQYKKAEEKALAKYQLEQIAEKKNRKEYERERVQNQEKRIFDVQNQSEDLLREHAQNLLREASERNLPIKPIAQAVNNFGKPVRHSDFC